MTRLLSNWLPFARRRNEFIHSWFVVSVSRGCDYPFGWLIMTRLLSNWLPFARRRNKFIHSWFVVSASRGCDHPFGWLIHYYSHIPITLTVDWLAEYLLIIWSGYKRRMTDTINRSGVHSLMRVWSRMSLSLCNEFCSRFARLDNRRHMIWK